MLLSKSTGFGWQTTARKHHVVNNSNFPPRLNNSSRPKTVQTPSGALHAAIATQLKQGDVAKGQNDVTKGDWESLRATLETSRARVQGTYGGDFTTVAMDCFIHNLEVKHIMQTLKQQEALGMPTADESKLYWAKSSRDKAMHLLAVKTMSTLNSTNHRSTLDFFALPGPFILPALNMFAGNGLVTPFGDAVFQDQPRDAYITDHDGYLADCRSPTPIIGRWLEKYWSNSMVCEPDPYPVVSANALSRLLSAEGFLEVVLSRLEAGRALLAAAASLGYEVAPAAALDGQWEGMLASCCFCRLGSMLVADVGAFVISFCERVMAKQAQVAASVVVSSGGGGVMCADSMAVSSTSSGGGRHGGGSGALTAVGAADEDGTSSLCCQPMVLPIRAMGLSGSGSQQHDAEEADLWSAASPLVLLADSSNSRSYVCGNEAAAKSRAGWWGRLRSLCGRVVGRARRS